MTPLHSPAACILLAVCSPAMAIDEPSYTVVRTDDSVEARRYDPPRMSGFLLRSTIRLELA